MAKRYSRLRKTQSRKNTRKAFIFILLSVAMVAFFVFVGTPLLIKYTSFVSDIRKSADPIERNDITPPPPPRIDPISSSINTTEIELSGRTEPGATVKIFYNSNDKELLTNNEGSFSTTLKLNEGSNKISFIAIDKSGNESRRTRSYIVTFDDKPPELTINSPGDGSSYYGSGQRQLEILGSTEENARVHINDRIAVVDDTGNFSYQVSLSEGENNFKIISEDEAGNKTEQELTVNYFP